MTRAQRNKIIPYLDYSTTKSRERQKERQKEREGEREKERIRSNKSGQRLWSIGSWVIEKNVELLAFLGIFGASEFKRKEPNQSTKGTKVTPRLRKC